MQIPQHLPDVSTTQLSTSAKKERNHDSPVRGAAEAERHLRQCSKNYRAHYERTQRAPTTITLATTQAVSQAPDLLPLATSHELANILRVITRAVAK